MVQIFLLLHIFMIGQIFCFDEKGHIFVIDKMMSSAPVVCSTKKEEFSLHKVIELLPYQQNGVIGIYKKSDTSGQICFFNRNESGLVPHGTLSGGHMYTLGK